MIEHERNPLFHVNPYLFPILHHKLHQNGLPLLPPQIPLAHLSTVLDAGCGLHHWGKALLQAMSEQAGKELIEGVRIDGIEYSGAVISHALSQLRANRGRLQVHQADLFDLPHSYDERYDLVHLRLLSPYVAPSAWPSLLSRLTQAARGGGWLVWGEPALPTPVPAVPAWQQWLTWIEQMVAHFGGSLKISAQMPDLLSSAGSWEQVECSVTEIPLGFSPRVLGRVTADQVDLLRHHLFPLLPLLVTAGVASRHQANETLEAVLDAFAWRRLASTWSWVTVWGKKAAAAPFGQGGGKPR